MINDNRGRSFARNKKARIYQNEFLQKTKASKRKIAKINKNNTHYQLCTIASSHSIKISKKTKNSF